MLHITLAPAFFQATYSRFMSRSQQIFLAPIDGTSWDQNDVIRLLAHW